MKAVYTWDGNNLYIPTANKTVPDDYQLAGNETFDEPPKDANGYGLLMPIKRQGSSSSCCTSQAQRKRPSDELVGNAGRRTNEGKPAVKAVG